MHCLRCGERLRPGDPFCPACGTYNHPPRPEPTQEDPAGNRVLVATAAIAVLVIALGVTLALLLAR